MPPVHLLQPKKILKALKRPHPQFHNTHFLDPYSGCELGCLYCYGIKENFLDAGEKESPYKVGVKTSSAFCLKSELEASAPRTADGKSSAPFSVGLGFGSDPYQPQESQYLLTRRCLEILKEKAVPVQVLTKSDLVLRDKDLLSEMSQKGLAVVSVSLFSLDEEISGRFEPRTLPPRKRLDLIKNLRRENIVCGAYLMPVFPYLTDGEDALESLYASLQSVDSLYGVPGILSLKAEAARTRILSLLAEAYPRTAEQYAALYDKLGQPALNYCERMEKIFERLAEKYRMPLSLPVQETSAVKRSLIVKDSI